MLDCGLNTLSLHPTSWAPMDVTLTLNPHSDSNRRLEPTGPQVPIPSRASLVSADEGTEKDGFGILEIAEITEELTTSVKAPA